MKISYIPKFLLILFISILIWGYNTLNKNISPSLISSLNISSDGRFVISVSQNNRLVLWDIQNNSSKLLSRNANKYSTYFIPYTPYFVWQNIRGNDIYVSDSKFNHIKKINPGFLTYGLLITNDLRKLITSDEIWNIYKIEDDFKFLIKNGFSLSHFGKNINFSSVGNLLLTSGSSGHQGEKIPVGKGLSGRDINPQIQKGANFSIMNGVVLWSIDNGKALYKLNGNQSKTNATLSPDGMYVASIDENGRGFVWETETGKQISDLYDLVHGKYYPEENGKESYFDTTDLIPVPEDYCWKPNESYHGCVFSYSGIAVKFINNSQFLRFTNHVPYAILYDVTNPRHKKYLKLEGRPSIDGYNESSAISTATDKNLLVMASKLSEGIRVYQFNPIDESLKLVWAPDKITLTTKQKLEDIIERLKL